MPLNQSRVRDTMRVLSRIPIPWGQTILYRLACEHPDAGFTSTRLREVVGLNQAQHRGLMAALAVRINNTPSETSPGSKPGVKLLFDQTWDGDEYTYRPHPELLEAIRRLPELQAVMLRPVEDVVRSEAIQVQTPDELLPLLAPAPAALSAVVHRRTEPFAELLDALERADLVFPSELLANVLLALQVKRFVILTGISGTGKSQIAQVLAARFSVRRRVVVPADPGEDAAVIQVMPYMLKYRRVVVPAHLAGGLPQLAPGIRAGHVHLRWPGGTMEVATWVESAYIALFKGALRSWFLSSFSEGDHLLVRVEAPAGASPGILVLDKAPTATVHEERVPNAAIVPVRPDWTDHRGLLGAYNPLTRQYLTTPFLDLLLRADDEVKRAAIDGRPAEPFFLVLDEMNLARVEHYFADFLSALESGQPLHLHDSQEVEDGTADPDAEAVPVPRQLAVPPNLFIVGTVNVDESTYMFSPKVLDRAFTIELNSVDLGGLATGLPRGGDLDLVGWKGRLDPPARPQRSDWAWLSSLEEGALVAEVLAFHRLLAEHNRHFGYRVATEIARFVRLATEQAMAPGSAAWAALDLALLQKVLVKLNGTRHELEGVLDRLLRFTLAGAENDPARCDLTLWRYQPEDGVVRRKNEVADTEAVFPRSAAKLWRMRDRLRETGFTSWIE